MVEPRPENGFEKLESALVRAGKGMAYPKTPAIAACVRGKLNASQSAHLPFRRHLHLRPRAGILVALVLVVALLVLIFPGTRDALAQVLGWGTVRATVTLTPTLVVTATPSPGTSTMGAPAMQTAIVSPIPARTPLKQCYTCGTRVGNVRSGTTMILVSQDDDVKTHGR